MPRRPKPGQKFLQSLLNQEEVDVSELRKFVYENGLEFRMLRGKAWSSLLGCLNSEMDLIEAIPEVRLKEILVDQIEKDVTRSFHNWDETQDLEKSELYRIPFV